MGAPDLLIHLRHAGLTLTLMPSGALHVTPRDALNDGLRAAIRASREELVLELNAELSRPVLSPQCTSPIMTAEQADACHVRAWNDAEIETFLAREARFVSLGRVADAAHLAERLTLRDREGDDRRFCLECAELSSKGHCLAARRGTVPGAERRCQPIVDMLTRCPAFSEARRSHSYCFLPASHINHDNGEFET